MYEPQKTTMPLKLASTEQSSTNQFINKTMLGTNLSAITIVSVLSCFIFLNVLTL